MADRYAPIGGQAVIEGVMMRSAEAGGDRRAPSRRHRRVKSREYTRSRGGCPAPGLPFSAAPSCSSSRSGSASRRSPSAPSAPSRRKGKPKARAPLRHARLGHGLHRPRLVRARLRCLLLPPALADRPHRRPGSAPVQPDRRVIRLVFFLAYIVAIGFWGEMQRVFQYHGAEHKTIHNLEAGQELTPENARQAEPVPSAVRHVVPLPRRDRLVRGVRVPGGPTRSGPARSASRSSR